MNNLSASEANRAVRFGRKKGMGFRVAEGIGVIEEETYQNGLWYLPIDSTQITKGRKQIEVLKSQFEIQQVIIAHEAPRLLCAAKKVVSPKKNRVYRWIGIGLLGAAGVAVAGYALLYILAALVPIALLVMVLALGLVVDPRIIVVLKDGSRVEVMRWVE